MSVLSSALLLTGCAFLLLAAVGVVRMPDLYIRMSSASKAVTLGVGCLALGLALHMNDAGVTTRAVLLIVLFLLKAPVAAHMLGRAAYRTGVPLWNATVIDEMSGCCDEMKGSCEDERSAEEDGSEALENGGQPPAQCSTTEDRQ